MNAHATVTEPAALADGPDLRAEPDYYDFLTRREVEAVTGLKKTAIYERMAAGEFPQSRSLGGAAVRWYRGEIRAWARSRPVASGEAMTGEG